MDKIEDFLDMYDTADNSGDSDEISKMFDSDELFSLLDEITKKEDDIQKAINTGESVTSQTEEEKKKSEEKESEKQSEWLEGIMDRLDASQDHVETESKRRRIEDYPKTIYSDAQLSEIKKGIDHRLNVDIYSDVKYTGRQMREIRYGLERGLDISYYVNVYFRERQMKQIRIGLQDGLDVSSYARLLYSATDMKEKREALYASQVLPNIEEKSYDYDDPETGVHIYVEKGLKQAGIVLNKKLPETYSKEDIRKLLKEYDIVHGFDENSLPYNLANLPLQVKVPVMFATEPVAGKDGYYDIYFQVSENTKPTINDDGSVDYFTPKDYKSINRGDVVALYHEATKGANGINVMGGVIEGNLGHEAEPLVSDDLILSRDKKKYLSKKSGFLSMRDNKIYIMDFLTFDRSVGYTDGKITFDGTIKINGNVSDNIDIVASGDIIVTGFVGGANLVAGRDIVISGGVNSDGEGCITAKGNVTAAFFENARVDVEGNIEVGYSLNSNVKCGGILTTKGKKSLLCGGRIYAGEGVNVGTIGSKSRTVTYVEIGTAEANYEEINEVNSKIKSTDEEIDKIRFVMDSMVQKMGSLNARQNGSYIKLQATQDQYKEKKESLLKELKQLEYIKSCRDKKVIQVSRAAFENTTVCINGNKLLLREDKKSCVISSQGRTVIFS